MDANILGADSCCKTMQCIERTIFSVFEFAARALQALLLHAHPSFPPVAEVLLLQHGFRLLWAFAHKSTEWPEASNEGSGSILMNPAMPVHVSRLSDNRQYPPCSSCEYWWKPGVVASEAMQSLG